MSSSKKRRLNHSSELPLISAFVARQSPQNQSLNRSNPLNGKHSQDSPLQLLPGLPCEECSILAGEKEYDTIDTTELGDGETASADIEDGSNSFFRSRAQSPEAPPDSPAIVLSTVKTSKTNVQELQDGTLCLALAPGERLVILGQCEISVQQGQITLLGATLPPSRSRHRIIVPSSQSLPVIRCLATEFDPAQISIHQCETGLEHLSSLSPLFGRLWNDDSGPFGHENTALSKLNRSSFRILFTSDEAPKGAYLQPIISAPEWNEVLSDFTDVSMQDSPRILVCGPKSTGKSTFVKLLTNRLLSAQIGKTTKSFAKAQKAPGVAILDLDPGQPEYSVPGQLSLVHIREPNFGPPFAHPLLDGNSHTIRAHSIGAITPSMDPMLYMACAVDLYAHYRNLLSSIPHCPLVINTPGWVLGTGLEILVDLISKLRPTDIVYMSQEGPAEVVESLQDAAKGTPIITLSSQVSKYVTRTAAHLRTMQYMSYFHVGNVDQNRLSWIPRPLSALPPWEVRYSGQKAGILGIMYYGEQPPPELLLESINGSLLAVVVLDDMAAIPGWQRHEEEAIETLQDAPNDEPYFMDTDDNELKVLDDGPLPAQRLEVPLIIRTPKEDIPYFNPGNTNSLNPKHSHCIGFALVRGINVFRRRIQVTSPISASVVAEINETGKSVVLVGGKFDTPGWAYTEELMQKRLLAKTSRSGKANDMDVEAGEPDSDVEDNKQERKSLREGFHNAPWVERQNGSQGRVIGSRVWRVRRDLGRSQEISSTS